MLKFSDKHFALALLVLVLTSYALLFGKYRPAEVDDAWTASYVWSLEKQHSTDDTVFGAPSNVRYFGHIHAALLAPLADTFGWSKATFHGVNLIFMVGAALAWFGVTRKLLKDSWQALLFVVLLFSLEPFIGGAYKARSDALAFFLTSSGLFLATRKRWFVACLVTSIGVEIHAMAAIGYFWILGLLLSECRASEAPYKKALPAILHCAIGCALGAAIYFAIHPVNPVEIFSYLKHSSDSDVTSMPFNALTAHYLHRPLYWRFAPELLFWLIGVVLLFFKRKKVFDAKDPVLCLFWLTLAASLVIHRGNYHYVIFFLPPLFLAAWFGYAQSRLRIPALICLALYALTCSGALYYLNRNVDHPNFDRHIAAAAILTDRPILGPTNAWFVLREHRFYASWKAMLKGEGEVPERIYYIESPWNLEEGRECMRLDKQIAAPFEFNDREVRLWDADLSACK